MVEAVEVADDSHVALAIADDPANQRQMVVGWNLTDGHLSVLGGPGSGVTTTLRSAITALGSEDERPVWVYAVDHGVRGLEGIDRFAHVAPVITGADTERQGRLLQFLSTTFDERRKRRSSTGEQPLIVVAIDGVGSFCESNDVEPTSSNSDLLKRIGRDGPSVGIYLLLGAGSRAELPRELRQTVTSTVVLEQADDRAYIDLGVSTKGLPTFVPGRALMGSKPFVSQVIDWEPMVDIGEIKLRESVPPPEISPLSTHVPITDLAAATLSPDFSIPIGIFDASRDGANLIIRSSEHALIAGPSRSGRSNALTVIASQLRRADDGLVLVGICPTSASNSFSEEVFDAGGTLGELEHLIELAVDEEPGGERWVFFVDDADRIELTEGPLFDLARSPQPNVTIIATIRSSFARQTYGHWTRFIRSAGTGILLEPDPANDGELFGVRLPRQRLAAVPGRGYLISGGEAAVLQIAMANGIDDGPDGSTDGQVPALDEEE